jgi:hypothetical protein
MQGVQALGLAHQDGIAARWALGVCGRDHHRETTEEDSGDI